jgi:hypothetical protein
MTDKQIINKIKKIRSKNNSQWMKILSIAFKYNPEESKKIFQAIIKNDSEITILSKDLAK